MIYRFSDTCDTFFEKFYFFELSAVESQENNIGLVTCHYLKAHGMF